MEANTTEAEKSVDEKRAQYEQFTFVVLENGHVNVRNDSYGSEANDHIYSVNPVDGSCSCPHHVHRGARCKHIRAVANAPLIVSSARVASANYNQVVTDGGYVGSTCDRCDDPPKLGREFAGSSGLPYCPVYDTLCDDCILVHGPDRCDHAE